MCSAYSIKILLDSCRAFLENAKIEQAKKGSASRVACCILHARVANHSARFGSSCLLTELVIAVICTSLFICTFEFSWYFSLNIADRLVSKLTLIIFQCAFVCISRSFEPMSQAKSDSPYRPYTIMYTIYHQLNLNRFAAIAKNTSMSVEGGVLYCSK